MAFGPGSLLYESYGDRRGFLVAPVIGLMQLMYPDLGRGVEQHSEFYDEPLQRLFRSVPQIQEMIFDGPKAAGTAATVRDFHQDIKGEMPDGSRYHALDPDTYWWAHATFIDTSYRATDFFFARPMTRVQKQALYAESVEWWKLYGLSMRPVAPPYQEFREYWQHMLADVLEPTPAAKGLVAFFEEPGAMPQPWLPRPVWRAIAPLGGFGFREVVVGTFPPEVREMFGLTWTRRHQVAFEVFRRAVAYTWPVLPYRLRIMPRARAAYATQGRLGLRTALAAAEARGPVQPVIERLDATG